MKPRTQGARRLSIPAPPVVFQAGAHALSIVYSAEGRWTVSVDGGPAEKTFGTQVEAWEAGVREASALDQGRLPSPADQKPGGDGTG